MIDYGTGSAEVDKLLEHCRWTDREKLNWHKKLVDSIAEIIAPRDNASFPQIIVAYDNITPQPYEGWHKMGIPNGWPQDVETCNQLINEFNECGNADSLPGYQIKGASITVDVVISEMGKTRDGFIFPTSAFSEDMRKFINSRVVATDLLSIPANTTYIYPIQLFGSGYLNTPTAQKIGFYLPDRVVRDAKQNLCKILIHEKMEGHGYNLNKIQYTMQTLVNFYEIPCSSLGFLDCNYYTPQLQSQYGTKGFFFPNWELHLGQNYDSEPFKINALIHNRLLAQYNKLDSCGYRFVNLNRRIRPHRIIVSLHNSIKNNSKVLWSLLGEGPQIEQLMENFDYIFQGEVPENVQRFHSLLPVQIDVPGEINDVLLNEIQFDGCINLVSETIVFNEDTLFLSEKIYKPLYAGQPFIVMGNPGTLKLLKSFGYETFYPWIDERYDDIIEPSERMAAILNEVDRICNLPDKDFSQMLHHLTTICYRNYVHFLARRKTLPYVKILLEDLSDWVNNKCLPVPPLKAKNQWTNGTLRPPVVEQRSSLKVNKSEERRKRDQKRDQGGSRDISYT